MGESYDTTRSPPASPSARPWLRSSRPLVLLSLSARTTKGVVSAMGRKTWARGETRLCPLGEDMRPRPAAIGRDTEETDVRPSACGSLGGRESSRLRRSPRGGRRGAELWPPLSLCVSLRRRRAGEAGPASLVLCGFGSRLRERGERKPLSRALHVGGVPVKLLTAVFPPPSSSTKAHSLTLTPLSFPSCCYLHAADCQAGGAWRSWLRGGPGHVSRASGLVGPG